ncbi:NfeD family protein [Oscillatoria sp. CS-180]|uniref:NfeD family protein n=1 Tax=Oscillatoria sp. CS-180 TaxID=3021720 RepID=UPI00232BC661|nr:NfeD family protein [Oscillatoria sp. CS-180]MDB9526654.1 NfeD family protein [Oscillatoria sp. CS-180]
MKQVDTEILNKTMYGVVESLIAGPIPGRVRVMGATWAARLCIPDSRYILAPGTPVIIFGRRGNELLVLTTRGLTEVTP